MEFLVELLFDGLLLGSEHILTAPTKAKRSKWHWVRWVIVGLCYTLYLAFSGLFVFLAWFLGRELVFPRQGLEAPPVWMFLIILLVAGFLCWRTWKLTMLIYLSWQRKRA